MYSFDIIQVLLHPEQFMVWRVDTMLLAYLTKIKEFVLVNPWTALGIAWVAGWFVQRTPWTWDDKAWEWVKKKVTGGSGHM